MKNELKFVTIAMAAALLATPCFAQTPETKPDDTIYPKYYRLDFTVKELEGGKIVNARSYSTSLSSQKADMGSIRTGDKVPTPTGKDSFTYLDVGVSIDCSSLRQVDSQLAIHVTADISSIATDAAPGANPLIRQNKWSATVLVPLRKTVTIFSSDGASTKRQTQLELTATPIP